MSEKGAIASVEVDEDVNAQGVVTKRGSHRKNLLRGTILTIIGGSMWGVNGSVASILMRDYAVDPIWLACFRELGACWLFLAVAWFTTPQKLKGAVRSPRVLLDMLAVAIASILFSQVAYLSAVKWSNPATATVLQSLGVFFVMAFVCVVNRRSPRKREIAGAALALGGTFLIATGGNFGALSLPPEGLVWGLGAAMAAAFLAIQPIKLIDRWGNFVVNGIAFLMSGLVLLVVFRPWNTMPVLDMRGWFLALFSMVVGCFGSYAFFLQGIKEVGSMRGAMLATSEPVVATLSSVLLLGIVFTPADLAGFAMIIAMVFLTA